MNKYQTNDIGIAAYLMLNKIKLLSADIDQTGRYIFVFEDPDKLGDSLSMDFLSSDFSIFDDKMRVLRKMIRFSRRN